MRTVQLFRDSATVLEKYQTRYLHLLIDEFQDTNVAQYVWARQLAAKHRNICVVGDPDQSIYSWRAADIRNILNFEQDYPEAKVVYLEENYRSTKTILEAASNVIAQNRQRKEVNLWTQNDAGVPISFREGYDEDEEAWFVAQEIERLAVRGPYVFGDCAVMYRTNAQSRALEEALVRYGFPYKLVGATRFYERREIQDVLAYLRQRKRWVLALALSGGAAFFSGLYVVGSEAVVYAGFAALVAASTVELWDHARKVIAGKVTDSVLTCPQCKHRQREAMPTDACLFFYECKGCGALLRPKTGDCCVFCSYGSVKCPPMQGAGAA